MNTAIDRKLVGQTAYESLRNDIVAGHLQPGQKLKLNELRTRYGASVNTLRETLMRLVSDGFVSFEDQKGFRVIPVSKDDLAELVELRVVLETLGLRKSMANSASSMDWKSRLLSAHYRLTCMERLMMEDEVAHAQDWEKADREFHMTIVSNCGSKQLMRYHASVIELFMRYQVLALPKRPFRGRDSINDHQQLLDLIMKDDQSGAEALLVEHIGNGRDMPL
ncbi:transcriptional regulator [Marinobacterium nitratireducens]|uniref:Transcriptional regulator n=1 Tax=Marinobacterium nitratireducens TaxID=518897 RepID=A0A917ZM91_9GAMM|nr:GntR family transcriptional regulator [Marinobacterium nitratireducens]GGO85899.1 transcriptional regulator [Marinobacterium nitratireducens]